MAWSSAAVVRPGPVHGAYPQRLQPAPPLWLSVADHVGEACTRLPGSAARRERRFMAQLDAARHNTGGFAPRLRHVRAALHRHGFTDACVAQAQALVAECMHQAAGRIPYPTQHLAAWAMLQDRLVEMGTGEGKSVALLMAAAVAALAGVPVHVVTANDYLAARDAKQAEPVLRHLGLTVSALNPAMAASERRAAYACDVAYCTANELGFDYLRDRLLASSAPAAQPVLRGLNLALIDEADSVLIDSARMPLIIATADSAAADPALLQAMWALSAALEPGRHFTLHAAQSRAELLPAAQWPLEQTLAARPLPATDARMAAQVLRQALVVRHLLQRDRHYLLTDQTRKTGTAGDSEIGLIDPTTGRVSPGTQWSRSIQPLIAIKEGLPLPRATRTAEQITLQTLFSRFWKLGGASGTLRESRLELFVFYRLAISRVKPRQPSLRKALGLRVFAARADVYAAIRARIAECARTGRPVLVGTESVAASEELSADLERAGIAHTVLNARHDGDEVRRVAGAGEAGRITISTHMAGRGTDIAPTAEALRAGGLHVISCTLSNSRRIDRQLWGRTARNGQPGSHETLLSLSDGVFSRCLPNWLRRSLGTLCVRGKPMPAPAGLFLSSAVQQFLSWRDLLQRWQLVDQDQRIQQMLAYARGAV